MKYIIFILLFTIKVAGQESATYFKRLSILNTDSERSVYHSIIGNKIYLNSRASCENRCSNISLLDRRGEIKWTKTFNSRSGNDNTIKIKDSILYLSTHSDFQPNATFQVFQLNKDTGDSIGTISVGYDKEIISDNGLEGSIINGDSLLLYGWAERIYDDTISGIIQWMGLDGGLGKLTQHVIPKNVNNGMFELINDKNNNLHFITYNRQIGSGYEDSRRITTLDSVGNIKFSFDYGHKSLGIFVPVGMTITPDDDFVFTAWQPDSIFDGEDTPRLLRTDRNGNVKWYYDWESKFFGQKIQYTISDVQIANNGDIIGCGYIFKGYYDGYIFRMSGNGTMLWERRYNILDSLDDKFDAIFLNNVGEDNEGNIIASGRHTNSFNFDDKVVLIKTDGVGCIDSLGCDYRTIIEEGPVSVGEISDNEKYIIYPNPSFSSLFLNKTIAKPYSYSIYNLLGEKISYKETNSKDEIDISLLPTGNYLLNIMDKERTYQFKFIKI